MDGSSDRSGANSLERDPNVDLTRFITTAFTDSCPVKAATSGIGGFVLGGMFGLFMSSIDTHGSVLETENMKFREQIKHAARDMGRRSLSSAISFAMMGSIFSGSECIMQGFRAKHDLINPAVAGCFTGGVIAAKSGPKAMALGCAGFSAFSVAIEYWLTRSH